MSGCRLEGLIPEFPYKSITYLNLADNLLTGGLNRLKELNLKHLDLSNNKFSGNFSPFDSRLEYLNLSGNQFTLGNIEIAGEKILSSDTIAVKGQNINYMIEYIIEGDNIKMWVPHDATEPLVKWLIAGGGDVIATSDTLEMPFTNMPLIAVVESTVIDSFSIKTTYLSSDIKLKSPANNSHGVRPDDYLEWEPVEGVDEYEVIFSRNEKGLIFSNLSQKLTTTQTKIKINEFGMIDNNTKFWCVRYKKDTNYSLRSQYWRFTPETKPEYTSQGDSVELLRLMKRLKTDWNPANDAPYWNPNSPVWNWWNLETKADTLDNEIVHRVSELKLKDTKLSGSISEINLPYLKKADLSDNELSGELPQFLSDSLKEFKAENCKYSGGLENLAETLEIVDLSGNKLTGNLKGLNLPMVKALDLSNNQFTGNTNDFNNKEQIRIADFSFNQLSGKVDITGFNSIEEFHLGNNNFNEIGEIIAPKLQILHLDSNKFRGAIPKMELPELVELDLSGNVYDGELPYLSLPKLENLLIDDNGFSSGIENWNGSNLIHLSGNYNSFTGEISGLDMPKLTRLFLFGNHLTRIPDGNLPVLQFLQLGSNDLNELDEIPYSNLVGLGLADNEIKGPLTDFAEVPDLNSLFINNNKLLHSDLIAAYEKMSSGNKVFKYENQDTVPKISVENIESGYELLVKIPTDENTIFIWFKDGEVIDGQNEQSLHVTDGNSEYHADIRHYLLTKLFLTTDTVVPALVSVPDVKTNSSLYPNPASGFITISGDNEPQYGEKVEIAGLKGNLIKSVNYSGKIELDGISPGTYFLRWESQGKLISVKFIVR
jgi:hypothetical protein